MTRHRVLEHLEQWTQTTQRQRPQDGHGGRGDSAWARRSVREDHKGQERRQTQERSRMIAKKGQEERSWFCLASCMFASICFCFVFLRDRTTFASLSSCLLRPQVCTTTPGLCRKTQGFLCAGEAGTLQTES